MMPWTWCRGRNRGMTSEDCHSQASIRVLIWAAMVPWVVTTPLGLLVVPLVKTIRARRSGVSSGSALPPSSRHWENSSSSMASSSHRGLIWSSRSLTVTRRRTPVLLRQCSSSGSADAVLSGTAMPPARQIPCSVVTYSKLAGMRNATRSSCRSASPASKPPANRSICLSRSA